MEAAAAELRQWGKVLAESPPPPLPTTTTFDNRRLSLYRPFSHFSPHSSSPFSLFFSFVASSLVGHSDHSVYRCSQCPSLPRAQSWQNICPIRASCFAVGFSSRPTFLPNGRWHILFHLESCPTGPTRKRRDTKQQSSLAKSGHQISCCLGSILLGIWLYCLTLCH